MKKSEKKEFKPSNPVNQKITNWKKEINDEIYADTKFYQKIYKFEIGEPGEHDTWNNEADAFKHTYGSAWLSFKYNDFISKKIGDFHENEGKVNKQPIEEEIMDRHNNCIGRNIAQQIKKAYPNWENLSERELKNIIAQKVMEKMKNNQLIKKPEEVIEKEFDKWEKYYKIDENLTIDKKNRKNQNITYPYPKSLLHDIAKYKPANRNVKYNTLQQLQDSAEKALLLTFYVAYKHVVKPDYSGIESDKNLQKLLEAMANINDMSPRELADIIKNKMEEIDTKILNEDMLRHIKKQSNNVNSKIPQPQYDLSKYYPTPTKYVDLDMSNEKITYPNRNLYTQPIKQKGLNLSLLPLMFKIFKSRQNQDEIAKVDTPVQTPAENSDVLTPLPTVEQNFEFIPEYAQQESEQKESVQDGNGHWVTINGKHVFIKDK